MHRFFGSHGKGECQKHKDMLEQLVDRLCDKNYDLIATNIRYKVGKLEGEIDVLAVRDGVHHFYEIKSGKHRKSKAQDQYDRFRITHPRLKTRGIYVGRDSIQRLRGGIYDNTRGDYLDLQ